MFLEIFHGVLTILTIITPYFAPKKYLPYYLIYIIGTFASWAILDGDCLFTVLEDQRHDNGDIKEDPESFVLNTLEKLGIDSTNKIIPYVLDTVLYISVLVALYRFDDKRGIVAWIILLLTWIKINGGYLNKYVT